MDELHTLNHTLDNAKKLEPFMMVTSPLLYYAEADVLKPITFFVFFSFFVRVRARFCASCLNVSR